VEINLSNPKEPTLFLRCTIDDLILPANLCPRTGLLIAVDGDEAFVMEAVEAAYYELVAATADEVVRLERAGYRLLRRAPDFELHEPHDADRFGSCN
jgi:hypothetical protein